MSDLLKECLKRANTYYQNPTDNNLGNLQIIHYSLSDEEQELADIEIRKLLPSWNIFT